MMEMKTVKLPYGVSGIIERDRYGVNYILRESETKCFLAEATAPEYATEIARKRLYKMGKEKTLAAIESKKHTGK